MKFPKFVALLIPLTLCLAWHQLFPSEVHANAPTPSAQASQSSSAGRQNPVKATPENLAEAKKFFGFDCAMCHDITGDGKGGVGESMGLKMKDWREPTALATISDAEIFDIIVKGKGKMTGEGDRASADLVWKLVNYVRSLSKTETAAVPKSGASHN